ncbi:MAG: RnfABCDGE type electron transport complex subunit G [Oscillospiraceae bacterium]|jgi:electron transport complex protein RnfG|nr:RnfABCDGE type electron transport complex subunit G [Oscillospiraceae bacterium]
MKKSKILVPAVILTVICLLCAAALVVTNSLTAPKIAQREKQTQQATMAKLIPSATAFHDAALPDGTAYFRAEDAQGDALGTVWNTAATGYGGDITVMTAVSPDGAVLGVEILSLSETPGLGMKAENASFLTQFVAKRMGIAVSKNAPAGNEIQAITGATITSRAVTLAVNTALKNAAKIGKDGQ